jgi:hypothetical protein
MDDQAAPGPLFWIIWCVVVVFYIATFWKVFEKAGKPGWASIIPIYNSIVLLQIAGRPVWWFLLFLIPLVNIVIAIIVYIDVSKAFGHGVGFGWGLALLGFIFFPILAWGDSQYQGPPQHG